jgi:hypothetical protein
MANLKLKKMMLEVVDNQLRENDPPAAKKAYQNLLEAGYSVREAKEKIAAVVLTEIYETLQEKQSYDEARYTKALEEMVQQSRDFEDDHRIVTEWDAWDDLVQQGYDAQNEDRADEMIRCWWDAWGIFQNILAQNGEKKSVTRLMEEEGYRYPMDAWLQDFEMELGNTGEYEKRLVFCRTVLEILDWRQEDGSNFLAAIGDTLYTQGKAGEGREWFEDCLQKDRHNENILSVFSWCLQETEGTEAAYKLIRREVIGIPCTMDNCMLFERAKLLAEVLKSEEDLKWIESQLKSFYTALEQANDYNDRYDDFRMPVQQPIIKEQKIYPNDPCPCGSGRKYKKCCGKNK